MARSDNNLKAVLEDTADAIRSKTGVPGPIIPRDFADEISNIPTGGILDSAFTKFLTGDLPIVNLSSADLNDKELREGAFAFTEMHSVTLNDAWRVRKNMFYGAAINEITANDALIVEQGAFKECECEKIHLNNVYELNENVFSDAYFENISLPNIYRMKTGAFANCKEVKQITLGNNFLIGTNNIFNYCSNLESLDTKYGTDLCRGSYGFYNCNKLKTIKFGMPQTLGSGTFTNCYNLEKIENDFLLQGPIPSWTFQNCYNLKEINLFYASNIGSYAFYNCSELSKIILGNTSIASSAFNNSCYKLESIYFLTCSIITLSNSNAFLNTPIADSSYLGHFGSIYVPSSRVSIFKSATNWAFYSDRITALPSEFESQYVYAFEFANRSDITEIPISKANAKYVGYNAFYNCKFSRLENSSFEVIGQSAFTGPGNTSSLSWISLANLQWTVVSQLGIVFPVGDNIRYYYLPKCLNLSYTHFMNTSYFTSSCNFDSLLIANFGLQHNLNKGASLPNALYVGISTFHGASIVLSNIYMPKAITLSIGGGTNARVESSLYLPNIKEIYFSINNLISIDIPDALSINFSNCSNLTTINCPKVIHIGYSGFTNTKISKATFSRALEVTGGCFLSCSLLTKVRFDEAEYISGSAFKDCPLLSKVLFFNLENIAYNSVFENCSSLESIYLFGKSIPVLSWSYSSSYNTVFNNTPIEDSSYLGHFGSIYVPSYLLNEYKHFLNWSLYSSRFVGLTDEEMQDIIDHWDD